MTGSLRMPFGGDSNREPLGTPLVPIWRFPSRLTSIYQQNEGGRCPKRKPQTEHLSCFFVFCLGAFWEPFSMQRSVNVVLTRAPNKNNGP